MLLAVAYPADAVRLQLILLCLLLGAAAISVLVVTAAANRKFAAPARRLRGLSGIPGDG